MTFSYVLMSFIPHLRAPFDTCPNHPLVAQSLRQIMRIWSHSTSLPRMRPWCVMSLPAVMVEGRGQVG